MVIKSSYGRSFIRVATTQRVLKPFNASLLARLMAHNLCTTNIPFAFHFKILPPFIKSWWLLACKRPMRCKGCAMIIFSHNLLELSDLIWGGKITLQNTKNQFAKRPSSMCLLRFTYSMSISLRCQYGPVQVRWAFLVFCIVCWIESGGHFLFIIMFPQSWWHTDEFKGRFWMGICLKWGIYILEMYNQ